MMKLMCRINSLNNIRGDDMKKKNRILTCFILFIVLCSFSSVIKAEAKIHKYVPSKAKVFFKVTASFKSYRALVNVDKLNIRVMPTSTSKRIGNYVDGNIINIIGKSGSYLKTENGYISGKYTKNLVGMYISVLRDTKVINSANGKQDSRFAVAKKDYIVIGSKNDNILIKIGRINGYISQSAISIISDTVNNKIFIGWEYVNKKSSNVQNDNDPNSYVNTKSNKLGLDVLSPTWFDVTGDYTSPSSINLIDMGDKDYVTLAHKNGYEVWARFGETNKNRAAVEFSNNDVRTRIIDQISRLAITYDLDGINVDYEALGSSNKDGFTSFMKELYIKLHKLNLNVSVDITKISKGSDLYSMCYDRPSLSKYSDYLILMGYDEHVSSSKEPGSVGSYNWVDSAVKDILDQGVPKNKLILAVPFYLRDFAVIPYDSVMFNQTGKVYNVPIAIDNNKLADSLKGNVFKCLGTDGDWYLVDYNGNKGYIAKVNSIFVPANVPPVTTDGAIDIITGGGINVITGGAIDLTLPYDVIITKIDSIIYKNKYEVVNNKLGDAVNKDYYKYVSSEGNWYIIDYKGSRGYVAKSGVTYLKANSRSIFGSAISMQAALDVINQYGGSIVYDKIAKQKVGIYYKDGLKHMVWLETKESMGWRMDITNKYNLPGAAVWSLYWKPTDGLWETIKGKLKK